MWDYQGSEGKSSDSGDRMDQRFLKAMYDVAGRPHRGSDLID